MEFLEEYNKQRGGANDELTDIISLGFTDMPTDTYSENNTVTRNNNRDLEFETQFERINNKTDRNERTSENRNLNNEEYKRQFGGERNRNERGNKNRNSNYDAEYERQFGGQNENLNYLDDKNSNSRYNNNAQSYEDQLMSIFNQAREYNNRITDHMNMNGGQEKRKANDTILLMLEITKKMKASNKYPDIQQKHFMKISKWIIDDAKTETGSDKVDKEVSTRALKIADNPDKYIKKFREQQQDNVNTSSNSQGNKRNSRARDSRWNDEEQNDSVNTSSNSQGNKRNSRARDSRWNNIDYTWNERNNISNMDYNENRVRNVSGSKKKRSGLW